MTADSAQRPGRSGDGKTARPFPRMWVLFMLMFGAPFSVLMIAGLLTMPNCPTTNIACETTDESLARSAALLGVSPDGLSSLLATASGVSAVWLCVSAIVVTALLLPRRSRPEALPTTERNEAQ